MRAEKVFAALLAADAGVAAIVGSGSNAAIYGGRAPDKKAPPLLIYALTAGPRTPALDDPGAFVDAQIGLIVVAETFEGVLALGEAARLAVVNKVGTNVAATGVNVLNLEVLNAAEQLYNPLLKEFSQQWTYRVHHTEDLTP